VLDPELLTGLEDAVEAAPDNRALHFHLIALLLNGGLADRALGHAQWLLLHERRCCSPPRRPSSSTTSNAPAVTDGWPRHSAAPALSRCPDAPVPDPNPEHRADRRRAPSDLARTGWPGTGGPEGRTTLVN
jgi:hypothetical protein